MWLLDQWAERHILDAQRQGEFDDLPGSGQPLKLDDDSHVPPELRAAYRMLKTRVASLLNLNSVKRRSNCLTCSPQSKRELQRMRITPAVSPFWN